MLTLDTPLENLTFVSKPYLGKLKKLGIKTINDILFYFPLRYQDFSNVVAISKVQANTNVSIQGKILQIKANYLGRFKMAEAVVEDETGSIRVTWFGQTYITNILKAGDFVSLAGKVVYGKKGYYLSNPIFEKIESQDFDQAELVHTGRIVPMYPQNQKVSSKWIRKAVKILLTQVKVQIPEPLPEHILKENGLLEINKAIWQMHFPSSMSEAISAQTRFAFEQLFLLEIFVLKEKLRLAQHQAPAMPIKLEVMQAFVNSLPFKLTDDQKKAVWRILKDLEKDRPMSRLLEGDVGSGKTAVAAVAALNVIKNGCQVAFMAPTEILAKQHFKTIATIYKDFNVNIGFLTGKEDKFMSKKLKGQPIEISKKRLLEQTAKGEINILVGTHALIQGKVVFDKLGLVVIDEQHRFGVEQRANLVKQAKGKAIPHLLSMTATPIPRSLALTIYGDLDLTIIKQMPSGRKKIITQIVKENQRKETYQFVREQIKEGRQTFVICPRIQEKELEEEEQDTKKSAWADVKTVTKEFEFLQKEIFPDLKVTMLHGKMLPKEKEKVMKDFKNQKADILVSTSVVEVGIDVPNATVMMIEGAERFGLAQLHQFRGRVGRSQYQSYCFLLSSPGSEGNLARSKALVEADDGFAVAKKDLEIRGPGELTGSKQSGLPDIIMSSLQNLELVEKTRQSALDILEQDPGLKKQPLLAAQLKRFKDSIHLE